MSDYMQVSEMCKIDTSIVSLNPQNIVKWEDLPTRLKSIVNGSIEPTKEDVISLLTRIKVLNTKYRYYLSKDREGTYTPNSNIIIENKRSESAVIKTYE